MLLSKILKNKVAKNAYWIILCKIIQSVCSLFISILTARYLGPSNYGIISYAQSLVVFVTPIMQLGITSVIVRELIENRDEEGKIIGTSIVASLISAFFCMIGIALFVSFANAGEKDTLIVCILYSTILISQSLELIIYWFQSHYLSKTYSIVSLCVYFIISAYKVFLLATHKSVHWFALSNSLDYLLIGIILHVIYIKNGNQSLKVDLSIFRRIFNKSKYYIVSGLMVTICAQTDRIMLKNMIDDATTGYYSAAASTLTMTGFVFTAIIDSMRPSIFEHKKIDKLSYENSVVKLYSIILYFAVFLSCLYCVFAKLIIGILYGEDYLPAIRVLQILTWYTSFSYFGGAKDVWVLSEGKQKYLIYTYMAGAITNVLLNFYLIPIYGASGAAFASLVTQILVNIIMPYFIKPLRYNNRLLLKALNPSVLWNLIH